MALKGCNNTVKGICSVVSAVLVNLIAGSLFTFPNLISHYKAFYGAQIDDQKLYFVAPVGIFVFNSLSSISGFLDEKLGTRILNIIQNLLLFGGF